MRRKLASDSEGENEPSSLARPQRKRKLQVSNNNYSGDDDEDEQQYVQDSDGVASAEEDEMDIDDSHHHFKPEEHDAADDDEEEPLVNAAMLEATQGEKQRLTKQKSNTRPAESGIIQKVTLINFMCHKYLTVDLGPKVNFVIGHNGSGKSAILTAITVCLGGKATSTNRAVNMRGLIRNECERAEVEVRIKNQGEDAFKHEIYGDSITVCRSIHQNNSSQYKLKSDDGKVVSRARHELQSLCDHMALQPDNPLLLLSQDAAREFLASSKPEEFYQLFLKGTQLQQMLDDYEDVSANIRKIKNVMQDKMEIIAELERQSSTAETRWRQMETSRTLEKEIAELKHHIAWSQVYDAEEEAHSAKKQSAQIQNKVDSAKEKSENEGKLLQELQKHIDEFDSKIRNHQVHCQPLHQERDELVNVLEKTKADSKSVTQEERRINDDIQTQKRSIEDIDKLIESETRKNSTDKTIEKKQQLTAQLGDLERKKEDLESVLARDRQKMQASDYEAQMEHAERDAQKFKGTADRLSYDTQRISDEIKLLSNVDNNRFAAFGSNVGEMLREIEQLDQRRAFKGGRPVGPLGAHIKLLDPRWGSAIDAAIGNFTPFCFIVQHGGDVHVLQKLFEKYQYGLKDRSGRVYHHHDIIVSSYDASFNYTSGMPARDDRYRTIVEVMEIANPLVLQVMVDNYSVEGVILVENRSLGEDIMRSNNWPRNVISCFDMLGNKIGHRGRGHSVFNMNKSNSSSGFGTLCVADKGQQIQMMKRNLADTNASLKDVQKHLKNAADRLAAVSREKNALESNIGKITAQIRRTYDEINNIRDQLEALDNTSTGTNVVNELLNEKTEILSRIKTLTDQFPPILQTRQEIAALMTSTKAKIEDVTKRLETMDESIEDVSQQLEIEIRKKAQIEANKQHYETKLAKYESDLFSLKKKWRSLLESFQQKKDLATDFCEGVVVAKDDIKHKSTEHIEKALRNATAALKQRNLELGSLEDVVQDYQAKKEKYEKTKKDIRDSVELHNSLERSLDIRRKKWKEFRDFIVSRVTLHFILQLDIRGFVGTLVFNHSQEKLDVLVKTGEAQSLALTQNPNKSQRLVQKQHARDTRSLSGGEKSFSTVCFLLALWQAMYCPIRGLDEFDVFMDQVNRTMSVRMILDAAKSNQQTQYILITPQSIDKNLRDSTDVKIHVLSDPRKQWEGGQQTIEEVMNRGSR